MRKLLLLIALVVGGCGSQAEPQPPAFNATDVAWIQLMIPMDEQLVGVLGLAAARSDDPAVRRLAADLIAGHRSELAQLVALRSRAGAPTANVHEGHDMPGMMTLAEITALGKLRGPAFDRVLRAEVSDHLNQSLVVTRGVKSAGQEAGVKELASAIEQSRVAQVSRLAVLG